VLPRSVTGITFTAQLFITNAALYESQRPSGNAFFEDVKEFQIFVSVPSVNTSINLATRLRAPTHILAALIPTPTENELGNFSH
jgi:hypothetical protein